MSKWCIHPSGSDANSGVWNLAWDNPVQTWAGLLTKGIAHNDIVFFAANQPYSFGFSIGNTRVILAGCVVGEDPGDIESEWRTYAKSLAARPVFTANNDYLIGENSGQFRAFGIEFNGAGWTVPRLIDSYSGINSTIDLVACKLLNGVVGARKAASGTAAIKTDQCEFTQLSEAAIYASQCRVESQNDIFHDMAGLGVHILNGAAGQDSWVKKGRFYRFYGASKSAVYCDGRTGEALDVTQCTFDNILFAAVNNSPSNTGTTKVDSSIISRATWPLLTSGGTLNYTYTDIFDCLNAPQGSDVGHNIAADPLFLDRANDDYRIRDGLSPCEDTGNPTLDPDSNGQVNMGAMVTGGLPYDDPVDGFIDRTRAHVLPVAAILEGTDPNPTTVRYAFGSTANGICLGYQASSEELEFRDANLNIVTIPFDATNLAAWETAKFGILFAGSDLILLHYDPTGDKAEELARIPDATINYPQFCFYALNESGDNGWGGKISHEHAPLKYVGDEAEGWTWFLWWARSLVAPISQKGRVSQGDMEVRDATVKAEAAADATAKANAAEEAAETTAAAANATLETDVKDYADLGDMSVLSDAEDYTDTVAATKANKDMDNLTATGEQNVVGAVNTQKGVNEDAVDGLTGRLGVLPLAISDRAAVVVTRPDGVAENGVEPISAVIAQLVNGGSGGRHGIGIYRSYTNVIPNPHFGSGDTTGWNNTGGANRVGVIADSDAVSGYVAEVGDGVADTDIEYITYYENVTPGETVAISCRLRVVSGTIFNVNYDNASATFYDASNNPVSGGGVLAQFVSAPSVMKEYSGVFTAPATAAKVRIIFYLRAASDAIVHVEWGQITHTGFVLPFAVGTSSPGTLRYSIDDLLAVRSGNAWMQPFIYSYSAGEDILRYLLVGDDPDTLSLRVAAGGNLIFRLDSSDEISYSLGYAAEETKIQLTWDGVDTFYLIVGGVVRGSATAASMPALSGSWILGSDAATPPANQADGSFTQQPVPLPMSNGLSEASILALANQFSATTVPLSWTGRGPQEIADRQIAAIDVAKLVEMGFGYLLFDNDGSIERLDGDGSSGLTDAINTAAGT